MDLKSNEFKDQLMMQCQYGNNEHITKGTKIYATNEITLTSNESAYNLNKHFAFNETIIVSGVNESYNSFTCFVNKYNVLAISTISLQSNNDEKYLYIYFKDGHYFEKTYFDGETLNDKIYLLFRFYKDGTQKIVPIKFQYVTNTILRCKFADVTNAELLAEIKKWITEKKQYNFNEVSTDDLKSLLNIIFPNGTNVETANGNISDVEVMRFQFLYKDDGETYTITTTLKYNVPLYTIPLLIENKSLTDVEKELNIKEYFVDAEKEKAINKITDMEKDVYIPVIWNNKNDKVSDNKIHELRFNLHFRNHTLNDNWTTSADSFWNGNYMKNGRAEMMENVDGSDGKYQYFAKDVNSQADLLYYLGFTDKDIRYQKNRLKKSFLRILFYDSTNQANQNLLAYYTIFYNIGEAYSKYMRHYNDEDYYYSILNNDTFDSKNKLVGIRVNREPYNFSSKEFSYEADDIRIAAQFSVKDKYNSDSCSEGFYLYLWKNNDNGTIPTDIYMKVEFNHAIYGRSIPFMMPFVDTNKHTDEQAAIKGFEDILNDFNGTGTDVPYGIRQYLKYSYIHMKYRYDKENLRHVYYLDSETYGDYTKNQSVYDKDGILSFNLYEAKIV